MEKRILEIEADTLDEARAKAKSMVPQDFILHSEEIISDGEIKQVIAFDETEDFAFEKAIKKIPIYAKILNKEIISKSKSSVIDVKEFDEISARKKILNEMGTNAKITRISIKGKGKKGIIGFGKEPNTYEVQIFEPTKVQISYKSIAKIRMIAEKAGEVIAVLSAADTKQLFQSSGSPTDLKANILVMQTGDNLLAQAIGEMSDTEIIQGLLCTSSSGEKKILNYQIWYNGEWIAVTDGGPPRSPEMNGRLESFSIGSKEYAAAVVEKFKTL